MPNHIGLDIGTNAMKLVVVERHGKTNVLSAISHGPTPLSAIPPKNPQEERAVVDAIKAVVRASKVKTKNVVLSLHESQVFTRIIQMPVLSDRELSSALRWEAEQYIPIPIDDVVYQYQIIQRPKVESAGAKMDVFLVAARKTLVDQYTSLVQKAGFTPLALETEMIALARAIVGNNPYSPTTMIMHIGANETDFCVVRKGFITFARSMTTGGNAMTRAIASELGFEPAQAEQYKKAYGIQEGQMEGKIARALRPIVSVITNEMRRALAFYQSRSPQDPVKRITLSGGSARLPGLFVQIANTIGVETQLANPFFNVQHQQSQALSDDAPRFAVAVGLALKDDI